MIQEIGKQQLDLLSHTTINALKKNDLPYFDGIQTESYKSFFSRSLSPSYLSALQKAMQKFNNEEINILYAYHQPDVFSFLRDYQSAIYFKLNDYIQDAITHVKDDCVELPEWTTFFNHLAPVLKDLESHLENVDSAAKKFTPKERKKTAKRAFSNLCNDLFQNHESAIMKANKIKQENERLFEKGEKVVSKIIKKYNPLILSTTETITDDILSTKRIKNNTLSNILMNAMMYDPRYRR